MFSYPLLDKTSEMEGLNYYVDFRLGLAKVTSSVLHSSNNNCN